MSITTSLFRLQQLDGDIEGCERDLRMLQRAHTANSELQLAEKRLTDLRTREHDVSAAQRDLEARLADVESKIKRDQTRMYSGSIVDARELASLERELEHYAVQRDDLEGQVLEMMERSEELRTVLEESESGVAELRDEWIARRPELEQEVRVKSETLSRLRQEREDVVASLEARTINTYARLRSSLGHPVALLSAGVCGECRVAVPPKDAQHVRSGEMVTCPNCARILHVPG